MLVAIQYVIVLGGAAVGVAFLIRAYLRQPAHQRAGTLPIVRAASGAGVYCPHCHAPLSGSTPAAGQVVYCPRCSGSIRMTATPKPAVSAAQPVKLAAAIILAAAAILFLLIVLAEVAAFHGLF